MYFANQPHNLDVQYHLKTVHVYQHMDPPQLRQKRLAVLKKKERGTVNVLDLTKTTFVFCEDAGGGVRIKAGGV